MNSIRETIKKTVSDIESLDDMQWFSVGELDKNTGEFDPYMTRFAKKVIGLV